MMILVKIDRHEAVKTDAYTRWFVKLQSGERLELTDAIVKGVVKHYADTWMPDKTHWTEYLYVDEGVELIRVRRTGRGNINVTVYKPEQLAVPKLEELEVVGDR
jgi:hypothetical protein